MGLGLVGADESKRMIGILGCSSGSQRGRKAIPLYASQTTYVDEFRNRIGGRKLMYFDGQLPDYALEIA